MVKITIHIAIKEVRVYNRGKENKVDGIMIIQRRYVKIFRIMQNDPQGKAILYKAFGDAGRTDEDRDFTLNADAGIILNDAGMGSCIPNLRWILEEMDKLDKVSPYENGYTYRNVNKVTCWPSRKGSAALLCME